MTSARGRVTRSARVRSLIQESASLHLAALPLEGEILRAVDAIVKAYRHGHKVVLFGNGGSAADAQHIAAEFVGKFRFDRPSLPAIALSANTSAVTAIANDFSYDTVFERGVDALVEPGDVAIAISTSGKSPNVLAGAEAAKRRGATTIALCGSGGSLAGRCAIALAVPSSDTPRVQEVHITVGHIICELAEEELFGGKHGRTGRGVRRPR